MTPAAGRVTGMEIIRSVFRVTGRDGDFTWMIRQPDHCRSLFVFNDNEEQFYDFFARGLAGSPGGGNAAIRPFQGHTPPRAVGFPTGGRRDSGYRSLDAARGPVSDAVSVLDRLLASGNYERVVFSWNEREQTLGTGIFNPVREVKDHIVAEIERTVARYS